MKLLLDTHLLLWWRAGHPSLPHQARDVIGDLENTLTADQIAAAYGRVVLLVR